MNNQLLHILSSKSATLVLLVVYVILMASATILEKYQGTPVAKAVIYYSPLFIFLQLLLVINFLLLTWKYKLMSKLKVTYTVIHLAFILILTGALLTHLTGKEGMLHLREGQRSELVSYTRDNQQSFWKLPFQVELTDFNLIRYPGSQSPSSYESMLKIYHDNQSFEQKVFMNNVLDFKGYRIYQASYDPDEKGSILSVTYDMPGRIVTYCGYTLLFMSLLWMLFDRNSHFRHLWNRLNKEMTLLLVGCLFAGFVQAQNSVIQQEHAIKFGALPMQSHQGRIIPVNTFAAEITRKLKTDKVTENLLPEQFLLSLLVYPADWAVIPLIEIKDEVLAKRFGWNPGRISYREAFDKNGRYRLAAAVEKIYQKNPAQRDRMDKELLKIDDRINLLHELLNKRLLRIYPNPADSTHYRWLSCGELTESMPEALKLNNSYLKSVALANAGNNWDMADKCLEEIARYQQEACQGNLIDNNKIKLEMAYNWLNLPALCRTGYLLTGFFLLLYCCIRNTPKQQHATVSSIAKGFLLSTAAFFFMLHTACLGMRWYISGYAPWSNSYETMVFLAWTGVLSGFLFLRKNILTTALAILFGGIVLFVSGLSWMDPQITPLVPVLKSPWLMSHVASLIMAYGLLGLCCMISTAYLCLSVTRKNSNSPLLTQLAVINELAMVLGTGLLAVGIFLGAIWANESWGRYWSWDPKETWALITLIVYTAILHARWFKLQKKDWLFSLLSQLAFLSILMTFLGVNYFLSGMHSYGSHDALSGIPVWAYLIFISYFVLPGLISHSSS